MALATDSKQQVVATYRVHKTDTGSPEVQVAILSQRILQLQDHFKTHAQRSSFPPGIAVDGRAAAPHVEIPEKP